MTSPSFSQAAQSLGGTAVKIAADKVVPAAQTLGGTAVKIAKDKVVPALKDVGGPAAVRAAAWLRAQLQPDVEELRQKLKSLEGRVETLSGDVEWLKQKEEQRNRSWIARLFRRTRREGGGKSP